MTAYLAPSWNVYQQIVPVTVPEGVILLGVIQAETRH
jgi:hypothetical protein